MATVDPILGSSSQFQAHSDSRYDRGLRISWSGIVGGTAIGWALFSLLSLIGAAIGLAKFDPYSADPANGLGAGIRVRARCPIARAFAPSSSRRARPYASSSTVAPR